MLSRDEAKAITRQNFNRLWHSYSYLTFPLSHLDIIEVREDRLFLRDLTAGYRGALYPAVRDGQRTTERYGLLYDWIYEHTPRLFRRYDLVGNHRNWRDHKGEVVPAQIGWREIDEPSAQIIVLDGWIYEWDFDLYSSVRDLRGITGHFFIEWIGNKLSGRRTDPRAVSRRLDRRFGKEVG